MNEVNNNELKENIYDKVISKVLVVLSIIYLAIIIIVTFSTHDSFDVIFDIFPLFIFGIFLFIIIRNFSQSFIIKYPTTYKIAIWRCISIAIPIFIFSYTLLGFFSFFVLFITYIALGSVISSPKLNIQNANLTANQAIQNTETNPKDDSANIKIPTMAGAPKFTPPTSPVEGNIDYEKPEDYPDIFSKPDEELLSLFIKNELDKINYTPNNKLIPPEIKKRKYILRLIFAVLVFIYVCLFFFHFPNYTYIIGGIILFLVLYTTYTYDFMDYMKRKIRERPDEKISNLVISTTQNMVEDRSLVLTSCSIGIAILGAIILFINPVIIYEKAEDGYAVRYYAYGLTNFTTATIPETHKGKPVVSLRGNAFSNMAFLEEVTLPDTIKEIRGQAFKNDKRLKSVKLPANLEYLGGSAFYNCTSLANIDLPSTITYLGGNAFYNATSLKSIVLPDKITEINGGTFENCTSLTEIVIPDSVTTIGGGAFAHDTKLAKVTMSKNVTEIGGESFTGTAIEQITLPEGLKEIRGNTFEDCRSLKEISIPDSVQRIGGHAFYGCYNLQTVYISPRSELAEIGSSAFRNCSLLKTITIPSTTTISSNSFKGSPTKVYEYTINKNQITNFET